MDTVAQELIFYFINMPFRAVQFDNITSKFDSVASFCYRFAQLGKNCSLHKELPTSGLPISSLVHALSDNSVVTIFYPALIGCLGVLSRINLLQILHVQFSLTFYIL